MRDTTVQDVKLSGTTAGYRNRMEVMSDSGRKYIIAQRTSDFTWCCSCMGWTTHRKCRHLTALGLMPGNTTPAEIVIERIGGLRWNMQRLRDAGTLKEKHSPPPQPSRPARVQPPTPPVPAPPPRAVGAGSGSNRRSTPLNPQKGPMVPAQASQPATAQICAPSAPTNGLVRALAVRTIENTLFEELERAREQVNLTEAETALVLMRLAARLA